MCVFRVLKCECAVIFITIEVILQARERLFIYTQSLSESFINPNWGKETYKLPLQQIPAGQKGTIIPCIIHTSAYFSGRASVCVNVTLYFLHTCSQMLLTTLKMQFHTILNQTSFSVPTWNPSHSSVCLPVVIPTGISRVGIQSCSHSHKPHLSRSLNAQIWPEFLAWKKTVADIKCVSFFRVDWGKIDTFTTGLTFLLSSSSSSPSTPCY